MTTTIAIVVAGVLAALAVFLAWAARQPGTFAYSRSTIVKADAGAVFPLIADPVAFNTWNPFNKDPSIRGVYSGPSRGPGARYTFESKRSGTGFMEILEEQPDRNLVARLVMTKPMACDNRVEFRLDPVADGTRVTWAMSGSMSCFGKVLNRVIDCERLCGAQFERGLATLKERVEPPASRNVREVA